MHDDLSTTHDILRVGGSSLELRGLKLSKGSRVKKRESVRINGKDCFDFFDECVHLFNRSRQNHIV